MAFLFLEAICIKNEHKNQVRQVFISTENIKIKLKNRLGA